MMNKTMFFGSEEHPIPPTIKELPRLWWLMEWGTVKVATRADLIRQRGHQGRLANHQVIYYSARLGVYMDGTWLQLICCAYSDIWSPYFGQTERRGWRDMMGGSDRCCRYRIRQTFIIENENRYGGMDQDGQYCLPHNIGKRCSQKHPDNRVLVYAWTAYSSPFKVVTIGWGTEAG